MFKSLNYRKENLRLFLEGEYIPLVSDGDRKDLVCAFARRGEGKVVLVIVPRFLTHLIKSTDQYPLGREIWGGSTIVIPEEIPINQFRNIFTEEAVKVMEKDTKRVLMLSEVFTSIPVAMLESEKDSVIEA
jgi:(1->4)-alpha-D-glucan 1-alpha-D-glucosylmutase